MPEELTYDPSTGLIRIRAWGDETILDWTESKREIMRLHKEHNASRLFVDAREMHAAPSVLDILDFGDTWPQDVRAEPPLVPVFSGGKFPLSADIGYENGIRPGDVWETAHLLLK